jgi:hypothetical protein
MQLIDVYWTHHVNRLRVRCDCGVLLDRPSNVSLVECSNCGCQELWHGVDPAEGIWAHPVMRIAFAP